MLLQGNDIQIYVNHDSMSWARIIIDALKWLPEVFLFTLAPRTLVVKVHIRTLLVLVRNELGFFKPLEPCQVLFVESPWMSFQLFCCEIPIPLICMSNTAKCTRIEQDPLTADRCPVGNRRWRRECACPTFQTKEDCRIQVVAAEDSSSVSDKGIEDGRFWVYRCFWVSKEHAPHA